MNGVLIKNVKLNEILTDILIEGEKIIKISNNLSLKDSDLHKYKVINGHGKTVMPGFINMHTHSAMTLMRGISEDQPLFKWLETIWKIEANLDDELVYWGTKLACLEMIKTGTTCFNDQYFRILTSVNATHQMGLRSFQPFVILDLHDKEKAEEIKRNCIMTYEESKRWSPLNHFAIAIHSPYSVSEEMILWGAKFAKDHNLLLHIHLSETDQENLDSFKKHNLSPTAYLEKLGVLGPNVIAAHCLWLSEDDIKILAKYDVKVVHNINSNLKLASGYQFKYNELKRAGVTVSIGTDGTASSNNLDMLEAMKTTALIQKAWRADPSALPLNELLEMSTVNGAKSLNINAGEIKEGMLADLFLVDTNNYAFTPNFNFLANFVYSANSSCVDTLICNGKVLMENRVLEGEQEILDNVNRIYNRLLK